MKNKSIVKTGIFLIALSVVLHYMHFMIFRDMHHIMIFLLADIAFIPLEVFLVTVVLDKMIEKREKMHLIEKLNMLVGLFYGQLGLSVFEELVSSDKDIEALKENLHIEADMETDDFKKLHRFLSGHKHEVDISRLDLVKLKEDILSSKDLLVSLIANPSLLEHESFSELLMSVFHLQEELIMRSVSKDQSQMKAHDLEHLSVDINRAYKHISCEWLKYIEHLKTNYPYLYVTALIKNPYDFRDLDVIERDVFKKIMKNKK